MPSYPINHSPIQPLRLLDGHSFITLIYIALLQGDYSEALPTSARPNNTDFSCRRNVMIETMFWEVIGEPRRDCSRLSDKQRDSTILPGGGVGKMNLKETLLSRTSGAGTDGPAPVSKVVRG